MKLGMGFIAGTTIIVVLLVVLVTSVVYFNDFDTKKTDNQNKEPEKNINTEKSSIKSLDEVINSKTTKMADTKNITDNQFIRKPSVAGQFYPADKQELEKQLETAFSGAEYNPVENLRVMIVPHAGLQYSGSVGAKAYSRIPHNKKRFIIIANSHSDYLDHIAIYNKGAWQTPLGTVSIDEPYANYLIDENVGIKSDLDAFKDHTIEMQVLMLQHLFKNNDFEIIPILITKPTPQQEEMLASKLANILNKDTLLIVSSDLSHYPNYDDAVNVDSKTIDSILTGNENTFRSNIKEYEHKNIDDLSTYACGYESIALALNVSQKLNNLDFTKLFYANSGDITGDHSRVVGYSAIIGTGDKYISESLNNLSESAKTEALEIARNAIWAGLNQKNSNNAKLEVVNLPKNIELYYPAGAFVTLKKNENLRGCIGHFETDELKRPLYKVIHDAAIDAAFNDPRFSDLTKEEFNEVEIEISIMTPRKTINSYKEIELGKDGVVVTNGANSGTFLPVVARDTGWTLDKFMSELCSQKAQLSPTCYLDPNTKIETFETVEFGE